MTETVFTNATLVLADRPVRGSVAVRDGRIASVDEGRSNAPGALDLEGNWLIPGLVELHTDNLEKHMMPRPGAPWPCIPAAIAHDGQVAACGITTVFDALAVGDISVDQVRAGHLKDMTEGIQEARVHGLLKADHLLHLRCEVADANMRDLLDSLIEAPNVRLLSVMDHAPGQRQFVSTEKYVEYYQAKFRLTDAQMAAFIEARKADHARYATRNRRHVLDHARRLGIRVASHDDGTLEHVNEAIRDGMTIAEFPTTLEAARASHAGGLAVMMGGPNLIRGGSHSGNVSAMDLARAGHLDIVSSDYAPVSLLHAAVMLAEHVPGMDLPAAIATVTRNPARAAGLDDRGEIALGLRADLARVRPTAHVPVVDGVWREGRRVA